MAFHAGIGIRGGVEILAGTVEKHREPQQVPGGAHLVDLGVPRDSKGGLYHVLEAQRWS
jgi:hypothetical protein